MTAINRDFIANAARNVLASIVPDWFEDARQSGHCIRFASPINPGHTIKLDLTTGESVDETDGSWLGNDLIDLYALSMSEETATDDHALELAALLQIDPYHHNGHANGTNGKHAAAASEIRVDAPQPALMGDLGLLDSGETLAVIFTNRPALLKAAQKILRACAVMAIDQARMSEAIATLPKLPEKLTYIAQSNDDDGARFIADLAPHLFKAGAPRIYYLDQSDMPHGYSIGSDITDAGRADVARLLKEGATQYEPPKAAEIKRSSSLGLDFNAPGNGGGYDIEAIKAANNTADIIQSAGYPLRRAGNLHEGLCPFHNEKTPSFKVDANGRYHCYGCGADGDVIEFVMQIKGLTFPEACEFLGGNREGGFNDTHAPRREASPVRDKYADIKFIDAPDGAEIVAGAKFQAYNPNEDDNGQVKGWKPQNPTAVYRFAPGGKLAGYRFRSNYAKALTVRWGIAPDGVQGWIISKFDNPLPLYRIEHIPANHSEDVLICEGEKTADALARISGMPVVGFAGTSAPKHTDWGALVKKAKAFVVFPDADMKADGDGVIYPYMDQLGVAAAYEAAATLQLLGCKVRIADVEKYQALKDGYDAADAEEQGAGAEYLRHCLGIAESEDAEAPTGSGAGQEKRQESENASYSWPNPEPLMRAPTPATEVPLDDLPDDMRRLIEAAREASKAHPATVLNVALAVASTVTQPFYDVRLLHGDVSPASLFLLTDAETSERKSTVSDLLYKGIRKYEAAQEEIYKEQEQAYSAELAAWKQARANIQGKKSTQKGEMKRLLLAEGPEPKPPLAPHLISTDFTIQGIEKNMPKVIPAFAIVTDEGGRFIGGHAMNEDNKAQTAAAMSNWWGGKPFRRTRAEATGNVSIKGRRITIDIMCQPVIVAQLYGDTLMRDQGFLSRLLPVMPDALRGFRGKWKERDQAAMAVISEFHQKTDRLLSRVWPMSPDGDEGVKPAVMELSSPAKVHIEEFINYIEEAQAPGGDYENIPGFAGKLAEQATRIAAVINYTWGDNPDEISEEIMLAGVSLAQFYANEALRIFDAGKVTADLALAGQTWEWIKTSWRQEMITLADLYQKAGPRAVRNKATAARIAGILADHGWIKLVTKPGAKAVYAIHPMAGA